MDRSGLQSISDHLITKAMVVMNKEYGKYLDDDTSKYIEDLLLAAHRLQIKKGSDYSDPDSSGDEVKSFKDYAEATAITPLQAFGVLYAKHQSAIWRFIKNKGRLESEPIESRIIDSINYMILLAALVKDLGLDKDGRINGKGG